MIYTIGKTEAYEQYFREQENPQKGITGSVWETWRAAWWHTRKPKSLYYKEYDCYVRALVYNGYSVYGVVASWKWHTINTGNGWNDLLIPASLIKVRKEWGGTLA